MARSYKGIIADCLSVEGSSSLPRVASFRISSAKLTKLSLIMKLKVDPAIFWSLRLNGGHPAVTRR